MISTAMIVAATDHDGVRFARLGPVAFKDVAEEIVVYKALRA